MVDQEERIHEVVGSIMSLPGSELVDFIYLYGSVAQLKSHPGSDIDICIYHRGSEQDADKFLLGVMSAIDSSIFDVKLFRQLPIYIRIEVLKGRLLYSGKISNVYEIAYETIKEYEEFEPRFFDYIGKEALH